MSEDHREIEVKLGFASPMDARRELLRLGAVETRARVFEDNILLDRRSDPLHEDRKALRLRRVGDRAIVTYKGPVEGDHRHKVRVEFETGVTDAEATERLLDALGFTPHWRYQKYRTEFELDGALHACLDETPLGCFVELEGNPEAIDRAAGALGFSVEDYITDSYRELLEAQAKRSGREPWDLVFESEDERA